MVSVIRNSAVYARHIQNILVSFVIDGFLMYSKFKEEETCTCN